MPWGLSQFLQFSQKLDKIYSFTVSRVVPACTICVLLLINRWARQKFLSTSFTVEQAFELFAVIKIEGTPRASCNWFVARLLVRTTGKVFRFKNYERFIFIKPKCSRADGNYFRRTFTVFPFTVGIIIITFEHTAVLYILICFEWFF